MALIIQTTMLLANQDGDIFVTSTIDPLSSSSTHASVNFDVIVSLCHILLSNILVRLCSLPAFLQLLYALCI